MALPRKCYLPSIRNTARPGPRSPLDLRPLLAEELGDREDFPTKILPWSPEPIDWATVEILARAGRR